MTGPQAHWLADRRRLHLHHGPIDLILRAWGTPAARAAAYAAAHARFRTILEELTAELPALRSPAPHAFASPVARAMAAAIAPHRPAFITPMAAVAGAVADEILAHMTAAAPLARAYVNDGGDIALHLAPGETLTAAWAPPPAPPSPTPTRSAASPPPAGAAAASRSASPTPSPSSPRPRQRPTPPPP